MKILEQLGERVSYRKSLPAEATAGVSAILQGQHLVDTVLEVQNSICLQMFLSELTMKTRQ